MPWPKRELTVIGIVAALVVVLVPGLLAAIAGWAFRDIVAPLAVVVGMIVVMRYIITGRIGAKKKKS